MLFRSILVPKNGKAHQDISPNIINNAQLAYENEAIRRTRVVKVPIKKQTHIAHIAKRYRVSEADLKSWNDLSSNTVRSGTILKVHLPTRSTSKGKVVRASMTKS